MMTIALRIYAVLFGLFAVSTMLMPMDHVSVATVLMRACIIFSYTSVSVGIFFYAFDIKFLPASFWRFAGIFCAIMTVLATTVVLFKQSRSPEGFSYIPFLLMLAIFVFNGFLIHKLQKSLAVA
jgi:hypothetical protein